jgi:hypothetical protein
MCGLFLFGLGYDQFVGWLERNGYERGVTALLVVAGTLVTLLPILFIWGIRAFFRTFSLFVASGTPMIAGSLWRYVVERDEERLASRRAAELFK